VTEPPLNLPPPALTEHRGRLVVWDPWQPGLLTSLRFHFDMSCHRCGAHPDGAQPHTTGRIAEPGTVPNVVGVVGGREVVSGRKPAPALIELGASMCLGCRVVFVTSLTDPDWWWESAPDGALDLAVEHVERPAVPRPRPAPPVPAARVPVQRPPRPRRTLPQHPALVAAPGEPAGAAQRADVVAAAGERLGWRRPSVSGARAVPCPSCSAAAGASCTRPAGRGKRTGCPPHPSRVEVAGQQEGPAR
jgi:hypothetical protein